MTFLVEPGPAGRLAGHGERASPAEEGGAEASEAEREAPSCTCFGACTAGDAERPASDVGDAEGVRGAAAGQALGQHLGNGVEVCAWLRRDGLERGCRRRGTPGGRDRDGSAGLSEHRVGCSSGRGGCAAAAGGRPRTSRRSTERSLASTWRRWTAACASTRRARCTKPSGLGGVAVGALDELELLLALKRRRHPACGRLAAVDGLEADDAVRADLKR